jgi:hypothetical protein
MCLWSVDFDSVRQLCSLLLGADQHFIDVRTSNRPLGLSCVYGLFPYDTSLSLRYGFKQKARDVHTLVIIIIITYGMTALYEPQNSVEVKSAGYFFFEFNYNKLFKSWGCLPHAQHLTWRTSLPYLWPPETGWPSYTPRHWVPILVAFYDTLELRWDYSYLPVTSRRLHSGHFNILCQTNI